MSNQRVEIAAFGGPEVIRVVEDPEPPEPNAGEVRIRVEASSAVFTDTIIRKGLYPDVREAPPITLGYDVVGVVDALGPGVSDVEVGQRVADLTITGGNAQYVCRPAAGLVPVPKSVDAAEAACLVLSYVTAYQMLHRVAAVERGQHVLVHGGSGAVGRALLQLCRRMDVETVATASAAKHELVREYGATPVDYRADDYEERLREAAGDEFDVAFDAVSLSSMWLSYQLLRRGGLMVAYGATAPLSDMEKRSPWHMAQIMASFGAMLAAVWLWKLWPDGRSAAFYSITSMHDQHLDWFAEDLGHLFDLLDAGEIKPAIAERLPLDDGPRAHEMLDRGDVQGRLVFVPDGSS